MCPASEMRTSYQVGKPWIFEGKILREATGTPIRRIVFANNVLALAEPEPLTLANLTTKSLILAIACDMPVPPVPYREETCACPRRPWGTAPRRGRSGGRRPRPSP